MGTFKVLELVTILLKIWALSASRTYMPMDVSTALTPTLPAENMTASSSLLPSNTWLCGEFKLASLSGRSILRLSRFKIHCSCDALCSLYNDCCGQNIACPRPDTINTNAHTLITDNNADTVNSKTNRTTEAQDSDLADGLLFFVNESQQIIESHSFCLELPYLSSTPSPTNFPFTVQNDYTWMVDKCPVTWPLDDINRQKCSEDYSGTNVQDKLVLSQPVFDETNKVTFKNKYCALCHGVNDAVPYKLFIGCRRSEGEVFLACDSTECLLNAISSIRNDEDCFARFRPPPNSYQRSCFPDMPDSAYWQCSFAVVNNTMQRSADVDGDVLSTLRDACKSFTNIVQHRATFYKNYHCMMCYAGRRFSTNEGCSGKMDQAITAFDTYAFGAILTLEDDQSSRDALPKTSGVACPLGYGTGAHQQSCHPILSDFSFLYFAWLLEFSLEGAQDRSICALLYDVIQSTVENFTEVETRHGCEFKTFEVQDVENGFVTKETLQYNGRVSFKSVIPNYEEGLRRTRCLEMKVRESIDGKVIALDNAQVALVRRDPDDPSACDPISTSTDVTVLPTIDQNIIPGGKATKSHVDRPLGVLLYAEMLFHVILIPLQFFFINQ